MSTAGSAASRSLAGDDLAQAVDVVGPGVAAEAPHLHAERGEAGDHPAADAAEADHERPLARQLPGRVPLPVPGLLPPPQVGHALDEVQGAHDRELGQRDRVDAARGGGGQAAAVEPGSLHERADAGAGGLHPAQPAVLGQVGHARRVEPVEIEEHVTAGRDRPPPRQVALAQVPAPAVVVAAVTWHRQQLGLVGDPRHRRGGRDPRHLVRLEVGADDDGEPGGRLGHAELLRIARYQSIVDYRPSSTQAGPQSQATAASVAASGRRMVTPAAAVRV